MKNPSSPHHSMSDYMNLNDSSVLESSDTHANTHTHTHTHTYTHIHTQASTFYNSKRLANYENMVYKAEFLVYLFFSLNRIFMKRIHRRGFVCVCVCVCV